MSDCSPPGSSVRGIVQARYWSRLPFPSPGDLRDPGIGLWSPALQADSLLSEKSGKPRDGSDAAAHQGKLATIKS